MSLGKISPSYSIGQRRPEQISLIPGPGQYNLSSQKPFKQSFSRSPRLQKLTPLIPGPASYSLLQNLPLKNLKRSFSRAARMQIMKTINPGPGSYNLDYPLGKSSPKSLILGRQSYELKKIDPGPADYSPPIPKKYKFAMSLSQRAGIKSTTPGPGEYQIHMNNKPSPPRQLQELFRISKSPKFVVDTQNTPGPGSYSYTNLKKSPRYGFGGELKDPFKANNLPGPGQYEYQDGWRIRKDPVLRSGLNQPIKSIISNQSPIGFSGVNSYRN